MKFSFRILLASVFIFYTIADSSSIQAQTKPVSVTGTKVSLAPPENFTHSALFPGFGHEETSSSIMVTELPAPYSKLKAAFTKEGLATKGMTLLSSRELSLQGRHAVLLHAQQTTASTVFLKLMLLTGTETEVVLITASFPERLKSQYSAALEKSVLSAVWDVEAKPDPLAGLNFSIQEDPALKVAHRLSNTILLTKDGAIPGKPTNDPLFIVGSSLSQAPIPDVKIFAGQRLKQIEQVTGITIEKHRSVTIAGLPGSQIIAKAVWKDLPQATVTVFQILLVDEKNYFILQGFAPREEQQKYLAIFDRISKSFRKR